MFNSVHRGYPLSYGGVCRIEKIKTEKNGTHVLVRSDACEQLPPLETTDLGRILEDGTIPLERVNSKIFPAHSFGDSEQVNDIEQANENEQTNDREND